MNKVKTLMRAVVVMVSLLCMVFSAKAQQREVLLETTAGNIRIALFDDTPLHRDNFIKLVESHVYDSLLFHRVIAGFMIQGGDPDSRHAEPGQELGEGDLGYTVEPEIRLPQHYHRRGAVAAAREGDDVNPERRSSASQFYIVWGKTYSSADLDAIDKRIADATSGQAHLTPEMRNTYRRTGGTPHLDGQYTVFGEVTEGMDVVDRIQRADTDDNDRPIFDIRIVKATVTDSRHEQ
jgi:peptidyl-prolyl cis-trans isomerase B (cyclophilin B)